MLAITTGDVVKMSMTERQGENREKFFSKLAAPLVVSLGSTAIFMGGQAHAKPAEFQLPRLPFDFSFPTKAAYYPDEDGTLIAKFNNLPALHQTAISTAIDEPLFQLAVKEGDVNYLSVSKSLPEFTGLTGGIWPPIDQGKFISSHNGELKRIQIAFIDELQSEEHHYMSDSYRVRMTMIHEAVHALSDAWWLALVADNPITPELESGLSKLKEACRVITAENYHAAGISIDKTAELYIEQCQSPQLSQKGIDSGEVRFRCVDEGSMLMATGGTIRDIRSGHGYDNASELASSAITVLYLNPEYVKACFESKATEDKLLVAYVKAVLDITFTHRPEVETIIRENETASKLLDDLFKVA